MLIQGDVMKRPNLFFYATSELSQDAFICWLLSWASPELKELDPGLHECATKFINALFDMQKVTVPISIDKVEVRKQDKNIDVLCIINERYPILIEDKTGTKNHSGQLARYLDDIKGRGFEEKNIIPIYFKTEDQACYSNIVENGYQPFLRKDFLSVLNTYHGTNAILVDYQSYLQAIENEVNSFQSIEISKWGWYAWVGFYLELQKQLKAGHWDYVANPNGGFLGFWWHFQGNEDCKQYLQLEEDKLCFKISVKNSRERQKLRSKWHKIIKDQSQVHTLDLVKPSRFGNGEYMTVCILNGEYRETMNDKIDIGKTVIKLRKAEALLNSARAKALDLIE
jgi:hypothetical protein